MASRRSRTSKRRPKPAAAPKTAAASKAKAKAKPRAKSKAKTKVEAKPTLAPKPKRSPRGGTRTGTPPAKRPSSRRSLLRRVLPSERTRRRWRKLRRLWRSWPLAVRAVLGTAVAAFVWIGINGFYQVARKPSELFFPVSGALYKTPAETWDAYGSLFTRHSTATMTPALLAALAQVEGSGNPVARTYWRWALRADPFEVYRPASSAVGMYQITNATFDDARRYCIRGHSVAEEGPWHDFRSCWFNSVYTRTVPSHAIELTSAWLDVNVTRTLSRYGIESAALEDRQKLAAVIHLCGAGAGVAFARRGLRATSEQRCGDHDLGAYLGKVTDMRRAFEGLRHADG
jgi:hypothetical protein